jgi:Fur family transcriptional regulator, ferric uptake regulator
MPSRRHAEAESLVRQTGARATRPRIEILAVLLAANRALSHNEVERRVNSASGIDRVTVYRVLDWLSEQGLAHRIAGEDRVSRYNAVMHMRSRSHAHFQCEGCGTVICLDELDATPRVRVPRGFVFHDVALTVKGFCASCGHRGRRTRAQRASRRSAVDSRAAHK